LRYITVAKVVDHSGSRNTGVSAVDYFRNSSTRSSPNRARVTERRWATKRQHVNSKYDGFVDVTTWQTPLPLSLPDDNRSSAPSRCAHAQWTNSLTSKSRRIFTIKHC